MNSLDRFCVKALLFGCLPLLAFTLLLQHVEDKELAQVARVSEEARCNPTDNERLWDTVGCKGVDFVAAMESVKPVVLARQDKN